MELQFIDICFINAHSNNIGNDNTIRAAGFLPVIMDDGNHFATHKWLNKPLDTSGVKYSRSRVFFLPARWVEPQRFTTIHLQSGCLSE
ncbi:hypothetical protein F1880_003015 [Penicillium rolfsii]|nr:hypothetical protein F1880_003015 [Penicillium rolfsii]